MLDGLLGRGFTVKCKSLIKAVRARLEVVRRRADAKQRFLKEDLTKLLSNGLDINAYGRTEEYIAGMNLLSCYDFIEQSCEYILKQLSRMQKQGECPDECRQAVASLMFAAARLSDLPELRDLRDIFLQKYGNSLEVFVNQKFVEKLSSSTPATEEKKLKVLQDIASEYSIKWDSRGFERRRMAAPSVTAQVNHQKAHIPEPKPANLEKKNRVSYHDEGNNLMRRDITNSPLVLTKKPIESTTESHINKEGSSSRGNRDDILFHGRPSLTGKKPSNHVETFATDFRPEERLSGSSNGKMLEAFHTKTTNGISNHPWKGDRPHSTGREIAEFAPVKTEKDVRNEYTAIQMNTLHTTRRGEIEDDKYNLKHGSRYAIPPPYIKSENVEARSSHAKHGEDRHDRTSTGSKHAERPLNDSASCNRDDAVNFPVKTYNERAKKEYIAPDKVASYSREKEIEYQQQEKILLPKPRSMRKKPHNSSSSNKVAETADHEDDGVTNTYNSNSSRRKDHSRKGLQLLFDEEHHRKDEEEMIIDKLLMHYSKKPSSYDARKLKKKMTGGRDDRESSSVDRRKDLDEGRCEIGTPHPSRSISLPLEQNASPEKTKVFARANTFEPDNQARHVHPKLPDYDDLAARFAALKGR